MKWECGAATLLVPSGFQGDGYSHTDAMRPGSRRFELITVKPGSCTVKGIAGTRVPDIFKRRIRRKNQSAGTAVIPNEDNTSQVAK